MEKRIPVEPATQTRHDILLGEVLAARADPCCFKGGRWHFAGNEGRTIHYCADGQFFATGEAFEA